MSVPVFRCCRQTWPGAALGGCDAVLLQEAAQAEELAVRGGDLRFQVADRGAPRVAFLAELGGEDVHDVVVVRGQGCGFGCGTCGLLGAELLDPVPQVLVGVEEVEADPGGAGDRPEVDLVAVLDELADRGAGAGDGRLPLGLRGAAQSFGTALAGGSGGAGHDGSGFPVMVTGTAAVFW